MATKQPLFTYLKKSKHLAGCKIKESGKKCTCGFYAAVDDYLRLLQIQETHYRKLAEQIAASKDEAES